jgi:hypothetical protein
MELKFSYSIIGLILCVFYNQLETETDIREDLEEALTFSAFLTFLFKGEKKDCLKLNRELGKVAHQESLGS